MPVCGNYLFFELPKKIVLNPKDGNYHIGFVCGKSDENIVLLYTQNRGKSIKASILTAEKNSAILLA